MYLTKPLNEVPRDQRAGESREGEVDIVAALVANSETAEAVEPGERSFHHPPMRPEMMGGLEAPTRDAGDDASDGALVATALVVVALVGVEFRRTTARATHLTSNWWNGVEQRTDEVRIMDIRPTQEEGQGDPRSVHDEMAFRAGLAPIRRVRAGGGAPFFAATEELSRAARLQSSWPAARNSRKSRRCNFVQTPRCCQSRNRRQHVIPEPQPISCGRYSQGTPVSSTNRMPVSAARSEIRGRPPFGFRRCFGSNGAIRPHSASSTRGRMDLEDVTEY